MNRESRLIVYLVLIILFLSFITWLRRERGGFRFGVTADDGINFSVKVCCLLTFQWFTEATSMKGKH